MDKETLGVLLRQAEGRHAMAAQLILVLRERVATYGKYKKVEEGVLDAEISRRVGDIQLRDDQVEDHRADATAL